jgi:hypothetical protein
MEFDFGLLIPFACVYALAYIHGRDVGYSKGLLRGCEHAKAQHQQKESGDV